MGSLLLIVFCYILIELTKQSGDYIIGFRAHGAASKTVDLIAKGV